MRIKKVWAVYFSGTGTTEKTVRRIAAGMAQALDAELAVYDFTPRRRGSGSCASARRSWWCWACRCTPGVCPTCCCPT